MSLFVAPWPFGRNKARPLVGIADCEGLLMATSSKHAAVPRTETALVPPGS